MASRLRRALLAALVTASVVVPLVGASGPGEVPAPKPVALGPVSVAGLQERYAANREGIRAAERMADRHGDRRRAAALRTMRKPGRRFLSFDGRDGGRAVEVYGDLGRARRVAVLVPGSDTSLDTYARLRNGALALSRRLGEKAAVVSWLGYRTPGTVEPEVLTTGTADSAAPRLTSFVRELAAAKPGARISLLCHSYGSVVCARAAHGLDAEDIVLYGSPGTGFDSARQLRTRATVWAGRGGSDWIGGVPHVRIPLLVTTVGFGTDPVSREFGARVFDAGDAGHSDYLKPGSTALASMSRIVAGRDA
ncbi:alpha/beta hydrolase [Streptomyces luomodiensis]|uniref:Alpha/beta hydrolase n=1 Tax=Streptomyces luomodiensis TaxID=3026192 RepID=A0ABY9UXY4_9ACTN|nr:alpha/beta hydrolase [Streptomyces sp. SCA4-21]WNE96690.1 alpha/beta hydrolase [Streptomyces sp. SCA4-21]